MQETRVSETDLSALSHIEMECDELDHINDEDDAKVPRMDLWSSFATRMKSDPKPNEGVHRCNITPKDPKSIKKRLDISDFPCYGTQKDLDIFAIYAHVSNLRNNFVPCIDCDKAFQGQCTESGMCRYPSATFTVRKGEPTLDELGEPVYLSLHDGVKAKKKYKKDDILMTMNDSGQMEMCL